MALTVTLANLRTRVLRRADHENDSFVSTAEANDLVNQSIRELFDILVLTAEDYFTSVTPFTITLNSTDTSYSLPSDFYKLRGVDFQLGSSSQWVPLERFVWNERNKYTLTPTSWNMLGMTQVKYHLLGTKIQFIPGPPTAAGTVRVWYIAAPASLSSDSDTFDTINGWDEWVTVNAARKIKVKEESDTTALDQDLARLTKQIQAAAADRDKGNQARTKDINDDGQWYNGVWPARF